MGAYQDRWRSERDWIRGWEILLAAVQRGVEGSVGELRFGEVEEEM